MMILLGKHQFTVSSIDDTGLDALGTSRSTAPGIGGAGGTGGDEALSSHQTVHSARGGGTGCSAFGGTRSIIGATSTHTTATATAGGGGTSAGHIINDHHGTTAAAGGGGGSNSSAGNSSHSITTSGRKRPTIDDLVTDAEQLVADLAMAGSAIMEGNELEKRLRELNDRLSCVRRSDSIDIQQHNYGAEGQQAGYNEQSDSDNEVGGTL
jgi:hypothetical protein